MYLPLISVVIPTTDRLDGLAVCIQSVLEQDYQNIEIVIIGNNYKDHKTVPDLLKSFKSDKINYYYLEKCPNANVARNYGASRSQGKFLAFLDSDDFYLPNHLSNSYMKWKSNGNEATCVFSNFYVNTPEDRGGFLTGIYENNLMKAVFESKKLDFRSSTIFVKSEYFHQVKFDELQFKHQDWAFGLAYEFQFNLLYSSMPTVVIMEGEVNRMSSRTKPSASIRLCENYLKQPYKTDFIISRLADELKIGSYTGIIEYKKHFEGRLDTIIADASFFKKAFVYLALSNKLSYLVLNYLFRLRSRFK